MQGTRSRSGSTFKRVEFSSVDAFVQTITFTRGLSQYGGKPLFLRGEITHRHGTGQRTNYSVQVGLYAQEDRGSLQTFVNSGYAHDQGDEEPIEASIDHFLADLGRRLKQVRPELTVALENRQLRIEQ